MRILLAESDTSIAEGLRASLRCSGHAVDHVASGIFADSTLRGHAYDLLVRDLGLPQLDGSEVLRRLRSRGTRMPVLVRCRSVLNQRCYEDQEHGGSAPFLWSSKREAASPDE